MQEEKLPPQNLEAEQATLGSMMVEPGAASRAMAIVEEKDFYREAHQIIFAAMLAVHTRNEPVDLITVNAELHRRGKAEDVGGPQYLQACMFGVPTAAHVVRYATIVAEKSVLRKIGRFGEDLIKQAYEDPPDVGAFLDEKLAAYQEIYRRRKGPDTSAITLLEYGKGLQYTTWLWPGWLPRGYITVLAGDPGRGKSALALILGGCLNGKRTWPDGSTKLTPGNTLWIDTEEGQPLAWERASKWSLWQEYLFVPGQDGTERVRIDLKGSAEQVGMRAIANNAVLVVIDCLRCAHQADEDSSAMTKFLTEFAAMARDYNLAILLIHHLRKRSQLEGTSVTLDRLRGSTVIGATARIVWALDKPDEQANVVRLRVIKSNLALPPPALGMSITEDGPVFEEAPEPHREPTAQEGAEEFLQVHLQDRPQAAAELIEIAAQDGISRRTLFRAKKNLHIISKSTQSDEGKKVTMWGLPTPQEELRNASAK